MTQCPFCARVGCSSRGHAWLGWVGGHRPLSIGQWLQVQVLKLLVCQCPAHSLPELRLGAAVVVVGKMGGLGGQGTGSNITEPGAQPNTHQPPLAHPVACS